jgi:hypothetical protein
MKGVPYHCSDSERRAYNDFYLNQCGHGGSLPVYAGRRTQYGYGIGSIFGSLFRSVFPIIKSIAPSIGLKALQTGAQIVRDVREGQSFKESAKKRVLGAIEDTINNPPLQTGSGVKRLRRHRSKKTRSKKKKRVRVRKEVEAAVLTTCSPAINREYGSGQRAHQPVYEV